MRNLLVLPIVISLFFADFGAFAATARSTRSGVQNAPAATANNTSSAPVSARAAVRRPGTAVAQPTTQQKAPVSARAATTRNAPKTTASVVNTTASGAVSARAGKKQKAINMGTKVEEATANTIVSQECQDAYNGCMDSFCMLDNISGGRCQCSDRHAELEQVLANIMSLDQRSYLMATEGVGRLQMGQNVDEIMARVKSVADQVAAEEISMESKNKKKTLDLSSWNSTLFGEDEELEDIFEGFDKQQEFKDEFAGKTGDALHSAAAKMCKKSLPNQCQNSASMLQLVYAQKVKSDCMAYENSLQKQYTESADKLRQAEQSLRETALEQFQAENKYDLGGCVVKFKECMQTTAECGDDFSGCVADTVTLSIGDTQKNKKANKKKSSADVKMIDTGSTKIEIEAATYDVLDGKKIICESVLNSCVKVRDQVWNAFLRDIAPVIKTAQVNKESSRRMNCVSVIVDCVKTSCGSKWDENSDNYDACLNDKDYIRETCEIEAQKCGNEGLSDKIMDYVTAKLSAMKVDRCTTQVKECLQNENVCGKDYLGCLGLSSNRILDLCPPQKLTACMDMYGGDSAKAYVVEVAQGVALNINNSFAEACQNAVSEAMVRVCGSTDSCNNLMVDTSAQIDALFNYYIQQTKYGKQHWDSVEMITADMINEGIKGGYSFKVVFSEKAEAALPSLITMTGTGDDVFDTNSSTKEVTDLVKSMNNNLKTILASIREDTTIKACTQGISYEGFNQTNGGRIVFNGREIQLPKIDFTASKSSSARFPHLTDNIAPTLGIQVYNQVMDAYTGRYAELMAKRDADSATLAAKSATTAEDREQSCLDIASQMNMDADGIKIEANAVYNKQTSMCDIKYVRHECQDWDSGKGKCDTGECAHMLYNCAVQYNMIDGKKGNDECGIGYCN